MRRPPRPLASGLLVLAGVVVALTASASPAAAHGVGGVEPSNYETRLLGVDTEIDGLELEVIELGDRVELGNATGRRVVVLGYEGEPYLRIDPGGGVYENRRSPARWANRARQESAPAPASADAGAAPEWVRISGSDRVRWHDHRVHWMGAQRPPIVERSPGSVHELLTWEIVVEVDGEPVTYHGDLRWVPPPPAGPLLALAVALAAVLVVLGRTRWWAGAMATGVVVLVAAETAHLVGRWSASASGPGGRIVENLYSIAGIALGSVAIASIVRHRRRPIDATPIVLFAALVVTVAGGLADIPTLLRSQIPTALDPDLARLGVALTLGVGIGTLVVGGWRMLEAPRRDEVTGRPEPPAPAPAERATPERATRS